MDTLLDRLNKLLMANQMSGAMKLTLKNYLLTESNLTTRVQKAVQLVVTSPEFSVQK